MKLNNARHPLSGFVALQQSINIFNCNPQGTALQMKRRLIKMIENTPNDSSFCMYKINQLLQDVDLKMANINMKDPDGKKSLEREVLQTIFEVLRQVCRNTKDSKHSAAIINAAEFTGHSLMTWSRDQAMEWHTLQSQLSYMLSNELPTEDVREGKSKAEGNPLALAAKHQHKGKQQGKQSAPPPPQDKSPNAAWLKNWTCGQCGDKGHLPKHCTNPPNPNDVQLVKQAKREAAERQLENNKLRWHHQ